MPKIKIILSGVNMVEGGLLTIYKNCLMQISKYINNRDIEIIALVADKSVFNLQNIKFIEFPKSKKNWVFRLYYEFFYFKKISIQEKPDIWLSMHDTTPNVVCKKQFVYCHNPNMFYKPSLKDWKLEYKVALFYYFYKHLYKLNIKKNKTVFVQQNWIKSAFIKIFDIKNIMVAAPEYVNENFIEKIDLDKNKINFFFPTISRVFKNIELITMAIKMVPNEIKDKIKIYVTIDKNDNKYSEFIFLNYNIEQIKFIGKQERKTIFGYYQSMDCLIFPSKLETWGLPITEAKAFNKPMLLANLPYAKETVGNHNEVSFFDVNNPQELATLITDFVEKKIVYQGNKNQFETKDQLNNWFELFDYMLKS